MHALINNTIDLDPLHSARHLATCFTFFLLSILLTLT